LIKIALFVNRFSRIQDKAMFGGVRFVFNIFPGDPRKEKSQSDICAIALI
jgi:hypothetical protein